MPPTWNAQNLTQHHQKRITKDAGSFEDLLAVGQPMTEAEYDQRCQDAVTNAWAKYPQSPYSGPDLEGPGR